MSPGCGTYVTSNQQPEGLVTVRLPLSVYMLTP